MDMVDLTLFDSVWESKDSSQDDAAYETKMTAFEALTCIDDRWYRRIAGKKARWMDLIGDYAGNERFILDGSETPVWLAVEDLTSSCP
jgi:ATP-dependent RNA helicase DDX60